VKLEFDAWVEAPFATLGIRTNGHAVTALRLLTTAQRPRSMPSAPTGFLADVTRALADYLHDGTHTFCLPTQLEGTAHELAVWRAMGTIPPGQTLTYGAIADAIGSSARAVGTACGRNPIPIIVPCHRVVAANGMGGFMGGKQADPLAIKRWLLAHESVSARDRFQLQ
jgi:methylated-DNA-[protein]-cysteine S-methyltransferase